MIEDNDENLFESFSSSVFAKQNETNCHFFSILKSMTKRWRRDTRHDDIQCNDTYDSNTQRNDTVFIDTQDNSSIDDTQGSYSQNIIFFVAHEWAQQSRVFGTYKSFQPSVCLMSHNTSSVM